MLRGLRVTGSALYQVSTHLGVLVVANLTAVVLSLPLVALVGVLSYLARSYSLIPLGIALLLGVFPNPAAAGLQLTARDLARKDIISLSDQWDGLRQFWLFALKTWLVSLAGTIVIVANLAFYAFQAGQSGSSFRTIGGPLAAVWLFVLLVWVGLHLYIFPLLVAQEDRRLLTAYRNAFIMEVSRPFFTLTVTILWILLLLFTSATGLATIIGLAVGAAIQQNAFVRLLPTFRTTDSTT